MWISKNYAGAGNVPVFPTGPGSRQYCCDRDPWKANRKNGDCQIFSTRPRPVLFRRWNTEESTVNMIVYYRGEDIDTRIFNHACFHPVLVSTPFLGARGKPDEGFVVSDLPQTISYSCKLINNGKPSLPWIGYLYTAMVKWMKIMEFRIFSCLPNRASVQIKIKCRKGLIKTIVLNNTCEKYPGE